MKLALAFYKGRGGTWLNKLVAWAIRWRTNGKYSHCEIRFSNGASFSSSEQDRGTRFRWDIDYDPEKWDFVQIPSHIDEAKVRRFCEAENGKAYNWRAIIRFALGIEMFANGIWFCSQICTAAFQPQGLFVHLNPASTSPQMLWGAAKQAESAQLELFGDYLETTAKDEPAKKH